MSNIKNIVPTGGREVKASDHTLSLYFKEITKCEELDLEKFDLAESIVLELFEKCLESKKDELKKIKKKENLLQIVTNPSTKKKISIKNKN